MRGWVRLDLATLRRAEAAARERLRRERLAATAAGRRRLYHPEHREEARHDAF